MGASKIIAAVGSDTKAAIAREHGAHHVVNYTNANWFKKVRIMTDGKGVDVALEATGNNSLQETLRALAGFGRLVVFGSASGTIATLEPATIDRWLYNPAANQSITGLNIGAWFMERSQHAGAALTGLIQDSLSGALTLPKITTLPLSQAKEAHLALEERRTEGKLVLRPWQ